MRKGRLTAEQLELRSLIEQLRTIAGDLQETSQKLEDQVRTFREQKEETNDR